VPWAIEPVAVVIHDCEDFDGKPVGISPRAVLRKVLALYAARGWQPVTAPEMEFYLIRQNSNPHEPCVRPLAVPGVPRWGGSPFHRCGQ
jgi:glutamine synthetase